MPPYCAFKRASRVEIGDDGVNAALRRKHRRVPHVASIFDRHAAQQRLHLLPVLHLRLGWRVCKQLAPIRRCRVRPP